ncbi:hypothetical protein KC19_3G200500 [Ceratodon purpureus]|uniref:Phosphatidylinositol-specific phospholipase C X domain-containing protein n=1 Tax=Ceratodon purpureus TaxID=3225 RepID=A0A8T0IN85_CERPU|nr:hypothetical protein KC19_3G200500 [Ceratodon purpureus]
MGAQISRQIQVVLEEQELQSLEESRGTSFPGSNIKHPNHKEWMGTLDLGEITAREVVWPGTHNSATDRIGIPFFTRPFFQCQKYSIYEQLEKGVRVFDIRVQQDRKVCHGVLCTYSVDIVINDVKRFLDKTSLEFVILELRTEWKRFDPLRFDEYLISQLGDYLIPQDEQLLDKPLRELLPGRVFCVWKPSIATAPAPGSPLWTGDHLLDNWIDTDLPLTKFISNLEYLKKQAPNATRPYFYRVENTTTPQNTGIWCVYPVTNRIRGYARLFLAETFRLGLGDQIQILSEDFVTKDFVDACIGVTMARFALSKQDLLQPYQWLR